MRPGSRTEPFRSATRSSRSGSACCAFFDGSEARRTEGREPVDSRTAALARRASARPSYGSTCRSSAQLVHRERSAHELGQTLRQQPRRLHRSWIALELRTSSRTRRSRYASDQRRVYVSSPRRNGSGKPRQMEKRVQVALVASPELREGQADAAADKNSALATNLPRTDRSPVEHCLLPVSVACAAARRKTLEEVAPTPVLVDLVEEPEAAPSGGLWRGSYVLSALMSQLR